MATTTPAVTGTGTVTAKRTPVFIKVDDLKPGTTGHNVIVRVVEATPVKTTQKPNAGRSLLSRSATPARIAECLVGDATGTIIFTARNEQVDLMKEGATVVLRNAKIVMFKGTTMRLAVDKWGRVEVVEPENIVVNEKNNLSLVEYELVNADQN